LTFIESVEEDLEPKNQPRNVCFGRGKVNAGAEADGEFVIDKFISVTVGSLCKFCPG
jgi:hypothetical protein